MRGKQRRRRRVRYGRARWPPIVRPEYGHKGREYERAHDERIEEYRRDKHEAERANTLVLRIYSRSSKSFARLIGASPINMPKLADEPTPSFARSERMLPQIIGEAQHQNC